MGQALTLASPATGGGDGGPFPATLSSGQKSWQKGTF